MQQYLDLLEAIQDNGVRKPAARAGMPGTISLFGYQFRHNLDNGFPLLTTKQMPFKSIITELLWFLRGDTNIKYLVDRGVNIWNGDAYNYYKKKLGEIEDCPDSILVLGEDNMYRKYTMEEFVAVIKNAEKGKLPSEYGYTLGDCGYQYGKVWRRWDETYLDWEANKEEEKIIGKLIPCATTVWVDQITKLIEGLRNNPESRRHIVTAVDPAHDTDLALYWCHSLFQFNCRPISTFERLCMWEDRNPGLTMLPDDQDDAFCDSNGIPKYYLDCQMYQRSADVILGVPFNIASYALLTHIIAKMCNMVPGEYIHTFGDVHIYEDHIPAAEEQLERKPKSLPYLSMKGRIDARGSIDDVLKQIEESEVQVFNLIDYNPHPKLKSEPKLSVGT